MFSVMNSQTSVLVKYSHIEFFYSRIPKWSLIKIIAKWMKLVKRDSNQKWTYLDKFNFKIKIIIIIFNKQCYLQNMSIFKNYLILWI